MNHSTSPSGLERAPTARAGWSLKYLAATAIVVAMLVLALAVVGAGWYSARGALLATAVKTASDAKRLIEEKSLRVVHPGDAALGVLATDPLADATTLEQRLARINTLAELLTANNLAAAVFVGYTDGAFMLLRPLDTPALRSQFKASPKSNFMVQSVVVDGKGARRGEFIFYNAELKLLERSPQPTYDFDPRTRHWFQDATKTASSIASAPYIFFTTRQVGITLSQVNRRGNAVFGIDILLDDVAASFAELRTTPNTEVVLLNANQEVVAYRDMARVVAKTNGEFSFRHLDRLGSASLSALNAAAGEKGEVVSFQADGREWLGVASSFDVWKTGGLRLLAAAPTDDFLGELKAKFIKLLAIVLGITLLLLPCGWIMGAALGNSLDKLAWQAHRMSQFDFRPSPPQQSRVAEVNELSTVINVMGRTIQTFLELSQDMATEPQVERMINNVLQQMVTAMRCTAGCVYLLGDNVSAQMQRTAVAGTVPQHWPTAMPQAEAAKGVAIKPKSNSGVIERQIELRARSGRLEGFLLLQHADDSDHAEPSFTEFVNKLSGMLAVSIETRKLFNAQKLLLDGLIRLLADAIDAKSPYTGGHCERVPQLAGMLVDQMREETTGPYASFRMTEEERYEFHLGAWLHDCGKVTSPEHIIDKATKLEGIYNRIHEIRTRFDVLWRDAEVAYWMGIAQGGDESQLREIRRLRVETLQDDFAFVARCNIGGEYMAEADVLRLTEIGQTRWLRYFDNRLGLSADETLRVGGVPAVALPASEPLLADRVDHLVHWGERKPAVEKSDPMNRHGFDMALPPYAQNMGELYNLSIPKGTLTAEDRFKINEHMVQTLVMLQSLPWPPNMALVPEIAATHHEKLDGSGYPRKLPAARLTLADRVMALADIFEALTAADRPYKAPKKLNESLCLMAKMANNHHLDSALFRYFLESGLWLTFAEKFMRPEQIDRVDVAAIVATLDVAAAA